MTDADLVAELRVCSYVVPYGSISRRVLVSEAADAIERLTAERDVMAARVDRLTKMAWNSTGSQMSLGRLLFGVIWNGTEEYETPGWRAVLNGGDHVGVYATEAEARAALEAAAREATR